MESYNEAVNTISIGFNLGLFLRDQLFLLLSLSVNYVAALSGFVAICFVWRNTYVSYYMKVERPTLLPVVS